MKKRKEKPTYDKTFISSLNTHTYQSRKSYKNLTTYFNNTECINSTSKAKQLVEQHRFVRIKDLSNRQSEQDSRAVSHCRCFPVQHLLLVWRFRLLCLWCWWCLVAEATLLKRKTTKIEIPFKRWFGLSTKLCALWYLAREFVMRNVDLLQEREGC